MIVNPFSLIGDKIDKKDIFVEFKGIMGDDIPSLDFNDYTTNGWYENTGTNRTGSANVPHASDNGYLLVVSKSRTVYQYWYSTYQSLGTMVRARKNGTWGSWGTVALTSDITTHSINTEVAWGSSMSISKSGANSMLITGGRDGYGFQVFIPKDTNEYVILSNVNGCLNSISVVGDTITLTVRSSGYGSKCQIFVLWN